MHHGTALCCDRYDLDTLLQEARTHMQVSAESYRTDDLHQAAYVWCQGVEPHLERDGAKVQFAFDEERVGALFDDYVLGKGRVEPLRFSSAIRELKRRAREVLR